MNTASISLDKLKVSPQNVRKTHDGATLDGLKASILAHGLVQIPLVTEADDGTYYVVDGARRLAALHALQKEGKLPKDHKISCQLSDDENATELSLAANVIRQAMHPADEFEAFNRLATVDKLPAEKIAQRFGVSEKHVLQRMKLARVAPEILKDYRDGKLKLDAVMAFTLTDDQNSQRKVYKGVKDSPQAHNIRRLLTEKKISTKSKLAAFVGLEAYEKAGGKFVSDLFNEESFLDDAALVQQLAADKLKGEADKVKAEGWAWVESEMEDRHYTFTSKYAQIEPEPVDAPKKLTDKLAKLQGEHEKAEEKFNETDDEDLEDKLREKIDALESQIIDVEAELVSYEKYDPEAMKTAGAYVYVDHRGKLETERGLVSRQTAKKQQQAASGKPAKPEEKGMSQALKLSLQAFRLQVAEVALAAKPELAYDLLVYDAVHALIADSYGISGLDISFHDKNPIMGDVKDTAADKALAVIKGKLALKWLDVEDEAEQFAAFRKLTPAQKASILAYCVALTLEPQLAPDTDDITAYDTTLGLTEIDVADYWRPTAENYLGKITRDQLLDIGSELFGKQWAKNSGGLKKGQLVNVLHNAFAKPESTNCDKATIAKINAWLPEGMAFTLPENAKTHKRSWKRDEQMYANLSSFLGPVTLEAITPLRVEEFQQHRVQEVSPATVNRECALLKHMFNMAEKWDIHRGRNPVRLVKFLPENNLQFKTLSEQDERLLLMASPPYLREMIVFDLNVGLRTNEIFSLRWEEVDIENKRLKMIVKKNQQALSLPLNDAAFAVIEARHGNQHGPYVFYNPMTGDKFKDVKGALLAAVKRAGLGKVTWHQFRHTFASRLTRDGVDIVTVKELLGHANIRTTMRYAHSNDDAKRRAVDKLNRDSDKIVTIVPRKKVG